MKNRLRQLLKNETSSSKPLIVNKTSNGAELLIHDVIDPWYGVSSKQFADALSQFTNEDITIRLNSPGGDVFDGRAIASAVRAYKGKTVCLVEGLAASVASTIAVAADEVHMAQGSFMMVHRSWTMAMDNCLGLRQMADLLEKIDGEIAADYVSKSGCTAEQAMAWMDAETWFTADEAVTAKLANKSLSVKALANTFNLLAFDNPPQALLDRPEDPNEKMLQLRAASARRVRLYEYA